MKRELVLSVCVFGLLTASLGACTEPTVQREEPAATPSRYVEEELEFPSLLKLVSLEQLEDGSLWMLGQNGSGHHFWRTDDFGSSWEEVTFPWLEELPDSETVISAAVQSPDSIYLYCEQEQELLFQPPGQGGDLQPLRSFYHGDRSRLRPLEEPVRPTAQFNPSEIRMAGNQLMLNHRGSLQKVDLQTGGDTCRYVDFWQQRGSWQSVGGKLALAQPDRIVIQELATNQVWEAPLAHPAPQRYGNPGNSPAVALSPDARVVYHADGTGIYRSVIGSDIPEPLLSEDLTPPGIPSYLFADSRERLLLLADTRDGYALLRYSCDPVLSDLSQETDHLLTVTV